METELKDSTATSAIVAKAKRSPKPLPGLEIVWRFKSNLGWRKGYIKDSLAKGKVIHITEDRYSSPQGGDMVSVDDIDWHRQ